MKTWNRPELAVLDLTATENGKLSHKYEGIDGVDAQGQYNQYINKNGTGTFVVPATENNDDEQPNTDTLS